jgi:hypothetical protein
MPANAPARACRLHGGVRLTPTLLDLPLRPFRVPLNFTLGCNATEPSMLEPACTPSSRF